MLKPSHFVKNLPLPIAIIGMGVSGRSVYDLLVYVGTPEDSIIRFDQKGMTPTISQLDDLLRLKPKTIVVSPGVPLSNPWIHRLVQQGVVLTSELEIAYSFLTSEKIIGVTGSIGKSTTSALIAEALNGEGLNYFLGGNFGTPLASYIKNSDKNETPKAEWLVLELSSYQLENFKNLRCEYSFYTYLVANHLERYESKEDYYKAKLFLANKTNKKIFVNDRGGDLKSFLTSQLPQLKEKFIFCSGESDVLHNHNLLKCNLIGKFNLDNISMVAHFCHHLSFSENSYLKLKKFNGLPHRLENLGTKKNIRFINDSKSTTIESSLSAISAVFETIDVGQSLWVLLGGRDKNLPWENLNILKNNKQIFFVFFGEYGAKALQKSQLKGPCFDKLFDALKYLRDNTSENSFILLSPGGTSQDEFKSFEDRGQFFKDSIEQLWG